MTGLEITLNGERVTVATLNSEYGVISAIVSCSNLLDKEGETVTINVAGIDSQTRDKLQWFSKELQPLDEIGIRIVTSGDFDKPSVTTLEAMQKKVLEENLKTYYRLKEQLKDHL